MSFSLEELRKMNEVSPELQAALKRRPFPDLPKGEAEREARAAHLRTLRYLMPVPGPIPDLVVEDEHAIPAQDGYNIRVISYRPAKPSPPGPLVILFHEGGWAAGDLTDEEFNARLLTRDLGVTCLNVEYRLAPEHKFPTGINDCWTVVQWAAANASSIHADPTRGFIVGGSSAGGNISAIVSHLSRDNNLHPPITGQWLSVPYLIPGTHIPDKYKSQFISRIESKHDPILPPLPPLIESSPNSLTAKILQADPSSPLFTVVSPALYPPTADNQAGKGPLARAYFQVAGLDPLRDHALVYDRIVREEYGVETKVDVYPGFGHMFWTNWPEMETSKKFARDMLEGFRWLLQGE